MGSLIRGQLLLENEAYREGEEDGYRRGMTHTILALALGTALYAGIDAGLDLVATQLDTIADAIYRLTN